MTLFQKLTEPFPPDRVSWRVGSTNREKTKGMALAYIDARDVMDRLDALCTPAGWQCSYPHANGKTVCRIEIKIDGEWIGKEDGAGDTDVEAEKGALSDAFKRAAVRWGIGRYLYDLDSPWVEIEPMGKSYKIKDSEYRKLALRLEPRGRKSTSKAEDDAPEVSPAALYVQECIRRVSAFRTYTDLGAWYQGEEHRARKAEFGLEKEHVAQINAAVAKRKSELEARDAA